MKIFDEPLPYSCQLFHSLHILAMNGQADVKITYIQVTSCYNAPCCGKRARSNFVWQELVAED